MMSFGKLTVATAFIASIVSHTTHADCSWDETEALDRQETALLQSVKTTDIHRLSEAFGHFVGADLQNQAIGLDLQDVIRGIKDHLSGVPAPLTEAEYVTAVASLKDRNFQEIASQNLALANAFISFNAKNPGVVELIPGKVQVRILQQGQGDAVAESSSPQVNFSGRYLDGSLFGSSEEAGGPITVSLGEMIPGFREGIIGMREGEKRRIFIHPDLAYGTIREIPPNSLLVFEVEIVRADALKIETPTAQTITEEPAVETDTWDLKLDDQEVLSKPLTVQPAI